MLVIHESGVYLVRGENLLENRDPEQPIPILWYSMSYPRCCPIIQLLFPRFIRASVCLKPCVT